MQTDRWAKLSDLVDGALAQPPERREMWLEAATLEDSNLRAAVRAVLALEHQPGASRVQEAVEAARRDFAAVLELGPECRLGPYRLVREVGRGGMGVVYEASRDDGEFQQRVAIKLIARAAATPQLLRRFRLERGLLAGLDHPYIARILDGGSTPDGRPYFVMEYVEGHPLLDYCHEHRLALDGRLRLFGKVCSAVQHAHERMIVHRDIKPGNILVTAQGDPKLLDFGIAKVMGSGASDADAPPSTLTGQVPMTPEYASPEQVRGQEVTAATDVYALGAVLYELLTGQRAHLFRDRSPQEMGRVICDVDPPRPSTACPDLRKSLAGDLDNIVLRAMHKEPSRRYPSVRELAADIERHLTHHPVSARPDTFVYRSSRFARRHRWALAGGLVLLATLAGGIVASQYQARRAQRRFAQVRQLANTFLFAVEDSIHDLPGATPSRELIVRTGLQYLDSLAADAGGDLDLKLELAGAYEKIADVLGSASMPNLGQPQGALENYGKSRRLAEAVLAVRPGDGKAWRQLAQVSMKAGDLRLVDRNKAAAGESFETAARAVARAEATGQGDAILAFLGGGASLRLGDGVWLDDPDAALRHFEHALAAYERAWRLDPSSRFRRAVGVARGRLGRLWLVRGNPKAALPHLEQTVAIARELATANPQNQAMQRGLAVALTDYGDALGLPAYFNVGQPEKALAAYREASEIDNRLAAADPKSVLHSIDIFLRLDRIGTVLIDLRPSEAVRTLEQALAFEPRLGDISRRMDLLSGLAIVHQRLALALLRTGRVDRGLEHAQKAFHFLKADPEDALRAALVLGQLQMAAGQSEAARATWRSVLSTSLGPKAASATLRDYAELLEQAAPDCGAYRRAMELWTECARRGAPAAAVDPHVAQLRAKTAACAPQS